MAQSYTYLVNRFKEILKKHGKDVYLRRRCTYCTQSGVNAKYDDACTYCSGTGFVQKHERYTMRKMIIGNRFSFPTSLGIEGMGVLLTEGTYFFCEAYILPKYGDLIYDWCEATQSWDVYIINKAIEQRYDTRTLYYTCAGEIREGANPA